MVGGAAVVVGATVVVGAVVVVAAVEVSEPPPHAEAIKRTAERILRRVMNPLWHFDYWQEKGGNPRVDWKSHSNH